MGFHTLPKSSSAIPTFLSAGVPFINMYTVMDTTAKTPVMAHIRKIIFAVFSITLFILFILHK